MEIARGGYEMKGSSRVPRKGLVRGHELLRKEITRGLRVPGV